MNKETVFTFLRYLLTGIGAFLFGKNIFGHPIDQVLWQEVIGIIMALIGLVWAFVDKTVTLEGFQAILHQIFSTAGGFLVAWGKLTAEQLTTVIGVIMPLIAFIYGRLSTKKNVMIHKGLIETSQLKGVKKAA